MNLKYEYYFIPHGRTKEENEGNSNEIWLDVGGSIGKNVFDHHNCDKNYISTVDCLVNEIDLLEETKNAIDENETVRIFLHINPDVDAIFACFYIQYFLKNSKEDFLDNLVCSNYGKNIVQYVNDIDSGKRKNIEDITIYNLICHLDDDEIWEILGVTKDNDISNKKMEEALNWVKKVYEKMRQDLQFNIYNDSVPLGENDDFAKLIKEKIIKIGKNNYERDKRENRLIIKDVSIWTHEGKVEKVKAAIWNDVPLSPNSSYIYARNEGAVITFVPHHDYGNNAVRISINPEINEAINKYSLFEVAEMFEHLEQIYDKKGFDKGGELRRDYSHPRGDGKSKIVNELPFSITSDPWYVSEKGDIVDAPGNGGSLLPFSTMIEVFENITKMVKQVYFVDYKFDVHKNDIQVKVSEKDNKNKSIRNWSKIINNRLSGLDNALYSLVIIEIDSIMIAHNYNILDAYFMNISDGAYIDKDTNNVLHIDYRTHLYVNQANAVLFIATSEVTDNAYLVEGMLNLSDSNSVDNSKIIEIFSKIIFQREKFKILGRFIGSFKENEKKIKKENEELILLLAKSQSDECLDYQIELDVYQFIYRSLNVDVLKKTVTESMEMVSNYSKEHIYSNLNALSIITIPYILVSTLFQIGLLKFKPVLNLENYNDNFLNIFGWILTLIIVIIITLITRFFRKR